MVSWLGSSPTAGLAPFDQTTENQIWEIVAAGFDVAPKRIVAETVSGSVPTSERAGFSSLVGKLEEGGVLVVTKLDRLGRNAMDVRATVEALAVLGVRVHCLALGGVDLTSAAGKVTVCLLRGRVRAGFADRAAPIRIGTHEGRRKGVGAPASVGPGAAHMSGGPGLGLSPLRWPATSGRVERRIRCQRIAHPSKNPAAICSRLRHDQVSADAGCGTRVPDAHRRFEMNAEGQCRSA